MRASVLAEGSFRADGLRVAIIVARTNAFITERLLGGAREALRRAGARDQDIEVVRVPGALEIPAIARMLARSRRCDAIVCLGAVLRGGTPHFEYVSAESIRGVGQVALEADGRGVSVAMGILTCDTIEQAVARAGAKSGNKGAEAALAAIELCDLRRRLGASPRPQGRAASPRPQGRAASPRPQGRAASPRPQGRAGSAKKARRARR